MQRSDDQNKAVVFSATDAMVCPGCDADFIIEGLIGPPFLTSSCTFCAASDKRMLSCPGCATVYCECCIGTFAVTAASGMTRS